MFLRRCPSPTERKKERRRRRRKNIRANILRLAGEMNRLLRLVSFLIAIDKDRVRQFLICYLTLLNMSKSSRFIAKEIYVRHQIWISWSSIDDQ